MNMRFWLRAIGFILFAAIFFGFGWMRAWSSLGTGSPFRTTDSHVDFENERWILKTDTVHRGTVIPLDVSRWVVTLTAKSSGQSMALLTAHPSMTTDPWDTSLKFSQTADGFRYTSDVISFSMKWPEVDFHYQKGFDPQFGFGEAFYLGAPRY